MSSTVVANVDFILRIREKLKWNLSNIRFLFFQENVLRSLTERPEEISVCGFFFLMELYVTGENLTLLHKNKRVSFSHVKKFLL